NLTLANVRTGNNAPTGAVPMLDQRPRLLPAGIVVGADGPHIVRRDGRQALQRVEVPTTWAGNDAPARAVPMLGQRFVDTFVVFIVAHSPDIIRRDGRHSIHEVEICRAWAGYNGPARAVPVFGRRPAGMDVVAVV